MDKKMSADEMFDKIVEIIYKAGYVKQVEAKWTREEIYDGYDAYSYEVKYTCSNCLEKQKVNTRYCPVCGAKMGGAI